MAKQALDGTRLNAFGMDPDALCIVGHDTNDGPEHPPWDERAKILDRLVDEDFVQNIRLYGVLEPVIVRKNGERTEVIVGRRRVYAARLANKQLQEIGGLASLLVPTMVRRSDDAAAAGAVIAENEGRVNDSPIVLAKKIQRLLDRGYDERSVAITIARPASEVSRYVRLLDLDGRVQAMVDERPGQADQGAHREVAGDGGLDANHPTTADKAQRTLIERGAVLFTASCSCDHWRVLIGDSVSIRQAHDIHLQEVLRPDREYREGA